MWCRRACLNKTAGKQHSGLARIIRTDVPALLGASGMGFAEENEFQEVSPRKSA